MGAVWLKRRSRMGKTSATTTPKKGVANSFPAKRITKTGKKAAKPVSKDGADLSVESSQAFDDQVLDKKSQQILHEFDLAMKYGPCVGLTRTERWDRAHKLGMNPPENVKQMLETLAGDTSNKSQHEDAIFERRINPKWD